MKGVVDMNIQEIMKSRKIGMPKLEVIRFNSADVIATSAIFPTLDSDEYEAILPTTNPAYTDPGSYYNSGNNTQ